ncbi:MAG: VWA domain-containing protein [Alistipes sp.]|nr:VWA domain-containing protein [Alistipes sp.]MDO5488086.1 VWA domain-containing protein [Rikenellaceae bacterium]
MFRFANAEYLYLLILIPLLVAVLGYVAVRRKHLLARFGNVEIIKELMPDFSRSRQRLKAGLYLTALTLLILAAARPQLGSKLREVKAEGVEMMLVVDVSNSMLAEDFEPNRLERTKYAIQRLFESLKQERVGLVAFAGEPKVQLPITSDYRMAQAFTRRLSTSLVAEQGTAIGRALELAMLSYSSQSERSRVMVLITDGENHEDDAIEAAEKAAAQGIKIYTIGIGTPEGAPIEIDGEFVRDEEGEMVVSKLGEQMLEQIAATTSAAYVRATKQSIGLEEIVKSINEMERTELTTMRYEEYNEQYQYLVGAALLLLLLDGLVLSRRNPRLRKFNIFREQP